MVFVAKTVGFIILKTLVSPMSCLHLDQWMDVKTLVEDLATVVAAYGS